MKVSDTKIKVPDENGQKDLLSPSNLDDSLNRKYSQVAVSFVANMGTLAVGAAISMSGILLAQVEESDEGLQLTSEKGSWFASLFVIGSFMGSFGGGLTCEYFGRKKAMMIENFIVTCGYLCIWLSNGIPLLFFGRFLTGYANGSNKPSILPYTSEICQPRLRKFTGTLFVTSYTSGYAIMYILGAFLHWRTVSAILAMWPFLSFLLLLPCPESPSWLLSRERTKDAYDALFKIRGDKRVVENELKVMADNINKQKLNQNNENGGKCSILDSKFLKGTFIRPFLTLAIMYTFGINYTGAPTLGFYLIHILKRGKVPIDPYVAAAYLVTWRVILTICTSLFLAPFLPRRKLYITSGIILASGGLTFGIVTYLDKYEFYLNALELYPGLRWLPFLSIGMLYTGLSGGFGMITFAVLGELLPSNARGIGTGLVSAISTLSFFLIVKFTPSLLEIIDLSGLFWAFAFVGYSLVIFAYFCLPETYGKTLVDIENYYRSICYGQDAYKNRSTEKINTVVVNKKEDANK